MVKELSKCKLAISTMESGETEKSMEEVDIPLPTVTFMKENL